MWSEVARGLLVGLGAAVVVGLLGWSAATALARAGRRMPVRPASLGAGVAAVGLLGGGIAGPLTAGGTSTTIAVSERACGTGWSRPAAGRLTFQVTDTARDPAAVYLIDPHDNDVFAELTNLDPGSTLPLATTLTAGRYAFRCVFTDGQVLTSTTYVITGSAPDAVHGVPPMPDLALAGPVNAYRAYVRASLPRLLADVSTLNAELTAGELGRAKTTWLTAHLDYERLGAAYNTFGNFDDEINGMAGGLPGGTSDPSWTGFFRIEYGLWHGQSAAELRPLTARLVSDVRGLIQDFPSEDTDPADLPLRTHEILENGLQFQLTGLADYGSGTTLATLYANTQGTQAVLNTLTTLIEARDPGLLGSIRQGMATVRSDLEACRASNGSWTPAAQLSTTRRQRLDGDLGQLLEVLSQVPNLLQPRTSA